LQVELLGQSGREEEEGTRKKEGGMKGEEGGREGGTEGGREGGR